MLYKILGNNKTIQPLCFLLKPKTLEKFPRNKSFVTLDSRRKQSLRIIMLNNHGTVVQDKKYITFSMSHRTAFRGWMFMDVPYFPVPTDDPLEASRPLLQDSAAHTPPRAGRRGLKARAREKHWALQRPTWPWEWGAFFGSCFRKDVICC